MTMQVDEHVEGAKHASVRTYLIIGVVLTVLTAMEFGVYYIQWFHETGVIWPALIVLSIAKFTLVVGFYMHLKYDALFYRRVFVIPILIAIAMTIVVGTLTAARYWHGAA